jgi:purine-nucleoside phosphorylase
MSWNKDIYLEEISEAVAWLQDKIDEKPQIGIVLGTGLGALISEIEILDQFDYEVIPNFPVSTVESHAGRLIYGKISGKVVLAMQGRFHYYEGYSMQQIVFPIRVMRKLGIKKLLISNACGGLNPQFSKGDLMIMDDHINLLGENPLIGANLDEFGPRFPDMSEPYSQNMIEMAEDVALENKIKIQKGVYAAVAGPNLETRAEYRFLRFAGADVVGMSTVPENIAAVHAGMDVFAVSVITDECFPDALRKVELSEIIETANQAEPKLTLLMKEMLKRID